MKTVAFEFAIPDALHGELVEASRERSCSPKQVAAEALEVLLAGRREQRLRVVDVYARKGPRQQIAEAGDLEDC
jgi:hypothetical protein